jgi:hypothetical protein
MARIEYGDALTNGILQPGWTIDNDGWGLLTAKAVYKFANTSLNPLPPVNRGTAFSKDARLKLHKYSAVFDALGIATVTFDYVGIDDTQPGASAGYTVPNCSGENGLSTEKIETHPNFFEITLGGNSGETPIAGVQADWNPAPNNFSTNGTNLMEGEHGATFIPATVADKGGKFLGFFNQDWPEYYGKTSYLAPTTVFSGIVYTTEAANVEALRERIGEGHESNDLGMAGPDFVPTVYGTSWTSISEYPQLLVSKVNAENYGSLYKINYEIRYSREGFPFVIYPNQVY